jgi:hypothetical protein
MKTAPTKLETNELPPPAPVWVRPVAMLLICLGLLLALGVAAPHKSHTNVKAKQGTDAASQFIEEL